MSASTPSSQSRHDRLQSLTKELESLLKKAISQRPPSPLNRAILLGARGTNHAVARCVQAYTEAYDIAMQEPNTERAPRQIRRHNSPIASPPAAHRTPAIFRDFTACIAHGMLLNVIDTRDGSRILYGLPG